MFCAANHAATITGKVVTVADGDTITVIDLAPEKRTA